VPTSPSRAVVAIPGISACSPPVAAAARSTAGWTDAMHEACRPPNPGTRGAAAPPRPSARSHPRRFAAGVALRGRRIRGCEEDAEVDAPPRRSSRSRPPPRPAACPARRRGADPTRPGTSSPPPGRAVRDRALAREAHTASASQAHATTPPRLRTGPARAPECSPARCRPVRAPARVPPGAAPTDSRHRRAPGHSRRWASPLPPAPR